jgi:hypothetical protein
MHIDQVPDMSKQHGDTERLSTVTESYMSNEAVCGDKVNGLTIVASLARPSPNPDPVRGGNGIDHLAILPASCGLGLVRCFTSGLGP